MSVKLGYWKIRGLAQPIRLLLKYTNTEFEDVYYQQGGPPDFSVEEWFSVKYTLGFDFPNLPYLIDGDIKITQSNAILRHIARKHRLCGATKEEMTIVDMLENEIMDFRNGFVGLCYGSNLEAEKASYLANIDPKLAQFSKFLRDKPWLAGSNITFPDFVLYEMLDQHRLFEPTILDKYPNLKSFLDRFEELPAIKTYMASEQFMRRPVNNVVAQWK